MSTPYSPHQTGYHARHHSSSNSNNVPLHQRHDSSTAASSSSHTYGLPPPHRRIGAIDSGPPSRRPHPNTQKGSSSNSNNSHDYYATSGSSARVHSPPRKAARLDTAGHSSIADRRDSASSDRRVSTSSNSRRAEEPSTMRNVNVPDTASRIERFVSLLQDQQNLSKETQEIQVKNAAVIKYLHRDDISKENKVRAQKALDEINSAKRNESSGWRKVETQLRALIDQLLKYMNEDRTAVRDFVADRWDGKEKENPAAAATASARTDAPSRAVAPATAPSRSTSLEPGELPASQPKASKVVEPAATEKGKEKESMDAEYVELGTGKMTMRVRRFMKRLDEVENDVLETSERQDQMESMVEEMVRQEVEAQVQAFRTKRSERKARDEPKTQQGPDPKERRAAGENSIPQMARENGDNQTKEVAEPQGARVMPAKNGVTQGTVQQAQDQRPMQPRHARDEEPGMTREVALAFIESMRQEMRQEFDTKLYEQAKAHERALQDVMGQTTASVYRDLQTLTAMMAKHRDVLGNHGEAARRHEQILQGLLGTLSNIPRPHNAP